MALHCLTNGAEGIHLKKGLDGHSEKLSESKLEHTENSSLCTGGKPFRLDIHPSRGK